MKVLLVGLVIFVDPDAGRCSRGQEHVLIGHARRLGGGLHVVDVLLHRRVAAILDRCGAHDGDDRHDRAAHHRFLEVLRVVFGERLGFLLEQQKLLARPRLVALQAFLDIGEEARLREFAIGDDVDAAFGLLANAVHHGRGDLGIEGRLVDRLAGKLRLHHIEQVVRARQAPDMGGLDAIRVLLQRHGVTPFRVGLRRRSWAELPSSGSVSASARQNQLTRRSPCFCKDVAIARWGAFRSRGSGDDTSDAGRGRTPTRRLRAAEPQRIGRQLAPHLDDLRPIELVR